MQTLIPGSNWYQTKDCNPIAYNLFSRHYSARHYQDNRRQRPGYRNRFSFVGPGEKLVLMTPDCLALFTWRKFIDKSGQQGINCSVFRNEGPILSSTLILEAEQIAWQRWPGERLYTYVNQHKITSPNPGYCFKCAGWTFAGLTSKSKLTILEKFPTLKGHTQ